MNNTSTCVEGYRPTILAIPSNIFLSIAIPLVIFGVVMNSVVVIMLCTQKRLTNQEIYVLVLSLSSFIMIGPCLATNFLKNWPICQKLPRIAIDFLATGLQVTAGVNVWLTCCISIDRFLIVYYHAHYLAKETRARVLGKIAAIVLAHLFPALVSNLIHYVPDAVTRYVDPLEVLVLEQIGAPKPIVYKVQVTNQVLNVARLVADRAVPWVLCPMTYLVVFVLRNQQKRAVQQSPAQGAAAFAVTEARRRAEARIRRSRKLVVGISATVFISLLPETVLDFSTYALSVDLRSRAPIVGLIWYLPNLIDPMVCIVSLPSLKRKTGMILARLGCSGFVSTMTSGTERGATIG